MLGDNGWIFAAGRARETITELGVKRARRYFVEIDVEPSAAMDEERTQVVNAMRMVGMIVRIENGVQPVHAGIKQLFAQIRRGVDQNAGFAAALVCALDQK